MATAAVSLATGIADGAEQLACGAERLMTYHKPLLDLSINPQCSTGEEGLSNQGCRLWQSKRCGQ